MAGADYLCCEECGISLCYDGDKTIREKLEWKPVFCEKCWIKMKKKILKLHSKNEAPGEENRPGAWRITIWKTMLNITAFFILCKSFF